MSPFRHLALAALALTAASLAAPAFAAPKGDCLWAATPEPQRKGYLDRYRESGIDSFEALDISESTYEAFVARCGVTDTPQAAHDVGMVLGSMVLAKGSEQVLLEDAAIPLGTLPRMWAALPEAERESVRAVVRSGMSGKPDEVQARATGLIIGRESVALGLSQAQAEQVFAYMFARSVLDLVEAGELKMPAS